MTRQEMENIKKENAIKDLKEFQIDIGSSPDDLEQSPLYYALDIAIKALEQPFINKPCVSEGVCHEDKMQVLDKIRAEIAEYGSICVTYAITDKTKTDEGIDELLTDVLLQAKRQVLDIIDKYRTESEVREEITTTCAECPYSDIYYWDQDPKTGKALPMYWCEKLKKMCDDKTKCKMQICKK